MNKITLNIWNRDFELGIIFQNYPGETISSAQDESVKGIKRIDFNDSIKAVKDFITKNDSDRLHSSDIDNVFRYVIPKCILVPRESDNRLVYIMCDYRFDVEHGIVLIYGNEHFKTIVKQDDVL